MEKSFIMPGIMRAILLTLGLFSAPVPSDAALLPARTGAAPVCSEILQPLNTKRFLIVFDQIAIRVISQVQIAHPNNVQLGANSAKSFDRLLNDAVIELSNHPSRFNDVIIEAQTAVGNKDFTFDQEVGIFLASRAQTLAKFIILNTLGFADDEAVAIVSTMYPKP